MRFTKLCFVLCITIVLTSSAVSAQEQLPRFEPVNCSYPGRTVECGFLVTLEDRQNPDGLRIKLPVAVIKSTSPNPQPDPVVYLVGGPGGSAINGMTRWLHAPFLADRDFIVFDQRGTRFTLPQLECPEMGTVFYDLLETYVSGEEESARYVDALLTCHDRLAESGVDLAAYNSAASAADLNDLRQVLGYDQWNLYGISYGTRLALTEMRDYPEGIRSVILDSVLPLQANLFTDFLGNLDGAFDTFFESCAADTACNTAYPDLKAVFYGLVTQLNAEPVTVRVHHPYLDKNIDMVVHGDLLIEFLFNWLYTKANIPLLPGLIYEMKNGHFERAAQMGLDEIITFEFISMGMYLSVECNEEVGFSTLDDFSAAVKAHPQFQSYFTRSNVQGQAILTVCDAWHPDQINPVENEPVVSAIPTLVMSGQFDPVTPPTWGEMTARTLSESYFYIFPGVGHGTTRSDACPLSMAVAFIDDPTVAPDSSCIASMEAPHFIVPD